jgi:protoporphyrinogen oxidase
MAGMDRGSIPVPDRHLVLQGFQGKSFPDQGYNPEFHYPLPSLRLLIDQMVVPIEQNIDLNQEVVKIEWKKRKVWTQDRSYDYEYLINTMPLNLLLSRLHPRLDSPGPDELKHVSTLFCNVVLKRQRKRFHWAYLPEDRFPCYRVGFYPMRNPPVCFLEKSLNPRTGHTSREFASRDISATLKRLGIIEEAEEIIHVDQRIIPVSYIIFHLEWKKILPPLLSKLARMGIHSIGRYSSMSDDIRMARNTARSINEKK